MAPAPRTPGFPPEQVASAVTASVAIIAQLVPLDQDAKDGIAQLATTAIVTMSASGAAVRLGRQKWWKNFMIDADNDPATPPTLAWKFLVLTGVMTVIAIGALTALLVVLL